jgi:hypothetical protein
VASPPELTSPVPLAARNSAGASAVTEYETARAEVVRKFKREVAMLGESDKAKMKTRAKAKAAAKMKAKAKLTAAPLRRRSGLVWATPTGHVDAFEGAGTIVTAGPGVTGAGKEGCTSTTTDTLTSGNQIFCGGRVTTDLTQTTGTPTGTIPMPFIATDYTKPGLARVQDFLRRIYTKLSTTFGAEIATKCSAHTFASMTKVSVAPLPNGGWDSPSAYGFLGSEMKIDPVSGAPSGPDALPAGTHSIVKVFKFGLGCCYASLAAIKLTVISTGQAGSQFVVGNAVLKPSYTNMAGALTATALADACQVRAGTSTTMKKEMIEAKWREAVAEFRFCLGKEVMGGPVCSPAVAAPPPPTPAPTAPAKGGGRRI